MDEEEVGDGVARAVDFRQRRRGDRKVVDSRGEGYFY
jgi:hypothetical protein